MQDWLSELPAGSKILDAGAGIMRYREHANHLDYTSQDFGEYEGSEDFGGRKVAEWDSRGCDVI